MIKSIELRNWKTHKDTKLDFSRGTNILIGQMGAGKSSIMDAISFALFGTFPAIQHKRVSVSRLIRNKPRQESSGSVRLVLEFGGSSYSIKRELNIDGKVTAVIDKDGAYLQSQPQRVTEEVERILKVDYDLFSKAVYSEQNQLEYFLDLRSADRKRQIDGLLGLDKFAIAYENSTSLTNRIRDIVSDSERMVKEFDIKTAAEALRILKSDLSKLESDRKLAEEQLSALSAERSKTEASLKTLKDQNAKKIALAKEIDVIKGRIGMLDAELQKASLGKLPKKEDAYAERTALQDSINKSVALDTKNAASERRLASEVAKLEAETLNLKKDAVEKEKMDKELQKSDRKAAEKELADTNALLDRMSVEVAQSKAAITDAEKQIRELAGHIGKCPICERDLDEHTISTILAAKKKLVQDNSARSKEMEVQISRTRTRSKEITASINSLTLIEDKLKGYAGLSERLKSAESSLRSSKPEYEAAKAAKDASSREIIALSEKLQKILANIDQIERIDRHTTERARLSSDLSAKSSEHSAIKVDDGLIDDANSSIIKITSEISKHTANIASATKYLKEKAEQITDKEKEMERIGALHEDLNRKKLLIENLSKFKVSLSETQTVLRTRLVNSINEIMGEVWKELYPYGDYESVTLDVSDDDYSLKVKTIIDNESVWEDVEAIASGGERSMACLAMRVAFSLVLVPNLKWLILDEPTHNIDDEGLSTFVRMFSETLPGIVDQVFIITHDGVLKQVSNARIYVLNRNKAENLGTEVAEA